MPSNYKDKYESVPEDDITTSTGYLLLINDTLTVSVAFFTPQIEGFFIQYVLIDESVIKYEGRNTFRYTLKSITDDVLFEANCYVNKEGALIFLFYSDKTGHFAFIVDK
jgi:hypothetical protein